MMKNKLLIFCCLILSFIDLTIQRHLNRRLNLINQKSLNSSPLFHLNSKLPLSQSLFNRSFSNHVNRLILNRSIPIYLVKKPIKLNKRMSSKLKRFDEIALDQLESNRVEQIVDLNDVNSLNKDGDNIVIIDENSVHSTNADVDPAIKKIDTDQPVIVNLDNQNNEVITSEEQLFAKRFDDFSLMRRLGGLTSLSSLLSTSQRRISPLNKIILGLLGPKLIKFQLGMYWNVH